MTYYCSFMKTFTPYLIVISLCISCSAEKENKENTPIEGTWKLLSGTIIEKGDTTVTDYTGNTEMIKIINATHFAFLNHDLNHGNDSTQVFVAGGGRYTLNGNHYIEHLDYCNDRAWEGHSFDFTVSIKDDTLVQSGIEKIEDQGIERQNVERYVRVIGH